jgi:choline dehydrogenase-like flavoprotein
MAGGDDEWAVIPPEPYGEPTGDGTGTMLQEDDEQAAGEPVVPRANDRLTGRTGCPINRCHGPKRPTWGKNGPELTNTEKTTLVEDYERARAHDDRGMTASGLAVFIRQRGVRMQSRMGYLGTVFVNGTPFEISPNGIEIVRIG